MVLNSILIQNFDDCEIIIADDHSTDNFMDEVKKYESILNIKYILVGEHKYHCPGNTRRDGLAAATGEWVTFIDNDDVFLENAFNTFVESVKTNDPTIPFMCSPIKRCNFDGSAVETVDAITWVHGKFYKRQFLIDNDINFKEDLFGNEDLYFNSLVYGTLAGQGITYLTSSTHLYTWFRNPESLSNKLIEGSDCGYTEKYFGDYLISNVDPHIICMNKYPWQKAYFEKSLIGCLTLSYMYYEHAIYKYTDSKILQDMLDAAKEAARKITESTGRSLDEFFEIIFKDLDGFVESQEAVFRLTGKFIPTHSLKEFFNLLK